MEDKEWLLNSYAYAEFPERCIWEAIVWTVSNMDVINKVIGKTPCNKQEREEIRRYLINEKKYELGIAMMCWEFNDEYQSNSNIAEGQRIKIYEKLAEGQLKSFLRWCDEKDMDVIFGNSSSFDLYRLCYIAIAVGYTQLAMTFMAAMTRQMVKEGGDMLDKYGNKKNLLFKKWVKEFYMKQPAGKKKKIFAKRVIKFYVVRLKETV